MRGLEVYYILWLRRFLMIEDAQTFPREGHLLCRGVFVLMIQDEYIRRFFADEYAEAGSLQALSMSVRGKLF